MLGLLKISVREIRSELGLSQSELAALVGIGTRAIQSYEQEWRQPSEMVERVVLLLLIGGIAMAPNCRVCVVGSRRSARPVCARAASPM